MAPVHRRKVSISLLIPFAIVALVFGALIWKKVQDSHNVQPEPRITEPAASRKGVLFFVSDGTRLVREGRELESCGETSECVRDLLEELFSGPVGDLDQAVPDGTSILSVHLEGDLAVVDVSKAFITDLPPGSSAEMMAVYSIINTVCFNYPQITRVRITVDGVPAGLNHLDLTDPLPPDYTLERDTISNSSAVPVTPPAPAAKKGHP